MVTAKGDEVKTAFDIVDAQLFWYPILWMGKLIQTIPRTSAARPDPRIQPSSGQPDIQDLRPAQLTDSGLSSHGAPIMVRTMPLSQVMGGPWGSLKPSGR